MLFDFIDFLAVILPTVIGIVSVWLSIKLTKGESHRFWWFVIVVFGGGTSALTWVSQSHAHKEYAQEVEEQKQAIDSLKANMQASDIRNASDMGFLKDALQHPATAFDVKQLGAAMAQESARLAAREAEKLSNNESCGRRDLV